MESWLNGGKMKDGEWLQVWNGEDLCACAVAGEHVWEFRLAFSSGIPRNSVCVLISKNTASSFTQFLDELELRRVH